MRGRALSGDIDVGKTVLKATHAVPLLARPPAGPAPASSLPSTRAHSSAMVLSGKINGFLAFFGALGLSVLPASAAPVLQSKRQADNITALSTAQVSAFRPYSYYATTGYCRPNETITWSCGTNCDANPDFIPVASGGDGDSVQNCAWFPKAS